MNQQRMVHFPAAMGLRPRPADDYDLLCLRLYRSTAAGNRAVSAATGREVVRRFGLDAFDDALSHGSTLAACELR